MYEYIIGMVTFISPAYIVVENQGIGYQVAMGNPYRYSSKMNQEVKIYLHQVVREDAHLLYGFNQLEEKQLFLRLISVSGIGPKSALAIMANEDHEGLIRAVETSDVTYLIKFPGVGKKTAQQMVLDLKGKLGELAGEVAVENTPVSSENQALDEALSALTALGYSDKECKRVAKLLKEEPVMATDEYLRLGLKLMMKK
ncbi:Holliday junction DNA helicase RuvA [Enterococcus phoeniculicola]|jgi:Holliday junction DNA helicase RuvA|uniref:Holliday junction branch migration complex subunit RuvA n=1 Tax=Enterococcus phoeniculicola ATCC BAA-412 TaxID=1158610 RepID=R3WDI3_9ENTE|nr:Holliday junction branch migration protein RuvA [Enterococcus phoeniculicola]EOL45482.1 Holliday junction DNA helicase RuvA [Enterococcus phoeniculicola ATCC BAA-412]EOT74844.1 Holliday junction DNA helicase RuvA [Enterococcus phoeniculicola ATCC BAA-412]OJG73718.1 Holliday junction DNA helicase RuvA [Enterococcus phoeniculicola]